MDRFSREARRVAEKILKEPCPFCGKMMIDIHYDRDDRTTVVRCGACMREFGDRVCFNLPFGYDELAFFERAERIIERLDGIMSDYNVIEFRRLDNYKAYQKEVLEKVRKGEAVFETDDMVSKDYHAVKWMFDLSLAHVGSLHDDIPSLKSSTDTYIIERIRDAAIERGLPEFEPTEEDIETCRLGLRRPHPWVIDGFEAKDMRDFEDTIAEVIARHTEENREHTAQ